MRRYLCLYFPCWSIQCFQKMHPETCGVATALFERSARGPVLTQCSTEAVRAGARSGMSVADARALIPGVVLHEVDPATCLHSLEELCLRAGRFSPLAGIETVCPAVSQAETLLLDITGCELVFRGEQNLLRQAGESLHKIGYRVCAAIAPAIGAAWALAHYGSHGSNVASTREDLIHALVSLPVVALRVEHDALASLAQLGIESIGELLKQPRATLPSRFGPALIERLDQALGIVPEMLPLLRPAPEHRVMRTFGYPLKNSELLFTVIQQMAVQLARELQCAQRGARQLECWLYHEFAQPVYVEVLLFRGSASGKHFWKLLHARLEDIFRTPHAKLLRSQQKEHAPCGPGFHLEAEEGVCAVTLHVVSSEPLSSEQLPLFDAGADASKEASDSLTQLLDRLASRLGSPAVLKVCLEEDSLPERAYRTLTLHDSPCTQEKNVMCQMDALRPLRLLPTPVALAMEWPSRMSMSMRGKRMAIRQVSCPERIESGWWRESDIRRDYYIVEIESGARYWLFKRLDDSRWFLHGTFE